MFHRPASLEDALTALRAGTVLPLAGGTDVFPALVDRPQTKPFLDLSRLDEIRGISASATHRRIGAATTWREIERAELPPVFATLKQAAHQVGSIQIQNRATIGGNLCNASPAADGAPPLLALDASVELASHRGRRIIPLGEFLTGNRKTARENDELLVAIHIPRDLDDASSSFLKLGARKYLVISIVMVAAIVRVVDAHIRQARVAVGAASVAARRLRALETRLVGCEAHVDFAEIVTADDLSALSPIDDVRASAAYRIDAAREVVARALREAVDARPA